MLISSSDCVDVKTFTVSNNNTFQNLSDSIQGVSYAIDYSLSGIGITQCLSSEQGRILNEKKEGVNNMNYATIVSLYIKKSKESLEKERAKQQEELINKDEKVIDIKNAEKECNETLKKLSDKYEDMANRTISIATDYEQYCSKETKEKIKKLNDEFKLKINELNSDIDELKARLELCEKGEDVVDVLMALGIMDRAGRLKINK